MSIESILLEHPASGTKANVLPSLGFNCYQFSTKSAGEQIELIWFDPALLEGKAKPTRSGIPILFPFASRIRGREISFEGQTYDVGEHFDDFGNPIHGFVFGRKWRVVEKAADRIVGEFQASVDAPDIVARWPADYRIRVSYQVLAGTLRSEIEVHNPDTKLLPFGFGTHGYFRLPLGQAGKLDQCVLTVPSRYRWGLDANLIPTHELVATPLVEELEAGLAIGTRQLDDLLTGLHFENGVCTTSLYDPAAKRRLSVSFGNEFANCVIFIPPHRQALCIEPYTTAPDSFRLQTMGIDANLRLLSPGKTWRAWVEMKLDQE